MSDDHYVYCSLCGDPTPVDVCDACAGDWGNDSDELDGDHQEPDWCPECGGDGVSPFTLERCEVCGGDGTHPRSW